jgi:hypothetical protein
MPRRSFRATPLHTNIEVFEQNTTGAPVSAVRLGSTPPLAETPVFFERLQPLRNPAVHEKSTGHSGRSDRTRYDSSRRRTNGRMPPALN